ncbi:MAG TPA: alanine racemase C-terminal domain-containing protein [Burkholderiaceae bacterium]|nr:alanine racemase C-terminal domain-containing protein [Burkholderiaceae bacterium]
MGQLWYGGAFVAETDMRIGLVPVGYGDGYPRYCGTGTPILVGGMRTRIVGRICMDVLFVDLTGLPCAGIGSPVELWCQHLRC